MAHRERKGEGRERKRERGRGWSDSTSIGQFALHMANRDGIRFECWHGGPLTLGLAMAKRSVSVGLSLECELLMTTMKSSWYPPKVIRFRYG